MKKYGNISLIGLPYQFGRRDDGHGYRMARGPEVLLEPDALPSQLQIITDGVNVVWLDDLDDAKLSDVGSRPLSPGDQMVRQLVQNNGLAESVRKARAEGSLPVVIAGGCNSSIGVVAGLSDSGIGLLWFDAHPDSETPETSPDGLFEGMPVAVIAGHCWARWREQINGFRVIPESQIIQIGLHDVAFNDPDDPKPLHIGTHVDPEAVKDKGFEQAFIDSLMLLSSLTDRVYMHFDTDVIDKSFMQASLHVSSGGPSPEQLVWATHEVAERFSIEALSFSSFDVAVDPNAPRVLVPLIADIVTIAMGASDG